jgi:hypothetical protein
LSPKEVDEVAGCLSFKKPLEARKGERKMLPIKGNEGRRLQIKSDSKLCFALTRKKWTYFDPAGNIKFNLINYISIISILLLAYNNNTMSLT